MAFMIKNPVTSGVPAYDGFNGRVWMTGKRANGAGTNASVNVEWMTTVDGASSGAAHKYDLFPASEYDENNKDTKDNWRFLATEAKRDDN